MKNLHLIPTDKPSRLVKFFTKKFHLCKEILPIEDEEQYQNIYITSDEEIKIGDWYLNGVIPTNERINKSRGTNVASFYKSKDVKKIILTTDQDLINDGVQAINDDFLEWFVNNPSCDEVEFKINYSNSVMNYSYKIIIPKEEPKQEIVEEREPYWDLVDKKAEQNNSIDLDAYAKGVLDGVKWQAERMYSEEDMRQAFIAGGNSLIEEDDDYGTEYDAYMEDWFKQFKKK